jgi:hypothetical protein
MRVLEARFRSPQPDGRDFYVVGYVVLEGSRPVVRPSPELMERSEPATTLAQLQFLVECARGAELDRLLHLQSRSWSFVEVTGP